MASRGSFSGRQTPSDETRRRSLTRYTTGSSPTFTRKSLEAARLVGFKISTGSARRAKSTTYLENDIVEDEQIEEPVPTIVTDGGESLRLRCHRRNENTEVLESQDRQTLDLASSPSQLRSMPNNPTSGQKNKDLESYYRTIEAEEHLAGNGGTDIAKEGQSVHQDYHDEHAENTYTYYHHSGSLELRDGVLNEPGTQGIADRLRDAQRISISDNKPFVPVNALEEIITTESVLKELFLSRAPIERPLSEVAKEICGSSYRTTKHPRLEYRKVFAILAWLNRPALIEAFLETKTSDEKLPLIDSTASSLTAVLPSLNARRSPDKRFDAQEWTESLVHEFKSLQWQFIVPFFALDHEATSSKLVHYKFAKDTILPFINKGASAPGMSGGFGHVSEVVLHPAHHNFHFGHALEDAPLKVAVKTLKSSNDAELWKKEAAALRRLQNIAGSTNHFIKPLSTFEHKTRQYLMFEWADGGNLRDLWREYQDPLQMSHDEQSRLTSFTIRQIQGISRALAQIHSHKDREGVEMRGRHGDLKPENILWFRDSSSHEGRSMGTLKIADFGLSVFYRDNPLSKAAPRIRGATPTYRAPEFDLDRHHVSRAYDIWSLGCILLETLIWLHSGWNEVEYKFTTARTTTSTHFLESGSADDSFFTVEKGKAQINPAVVKSIRDLQTSQKSSPWMLNLLDVLQTALLVVDPEKRLTAEQLARTFDEMIMMAETNPDYMLPRTTGLKEETPLAGFPRILGEVTEIEDVPSDDVIQDSEPPKHQRPKTVTEHRLDIARPPNLRVVKQSDEKNLFSTFDKLRVLIEHYVGAEIDWWPFDPIQRPLQTHEARLFWNYNGKEMSIVVKEDNVRGLSHLVYSHGQRPSMLPIAHSEGLHPPSPHNASYQAPRKASWMTWARKVTKMFYRNNSRVPAPARSPTNPQMDSYLCVDKCWTTIKDTKLKIIPSVGDMKSDYDYFRYVRQILSEAEGNWFQRRLSWRSYTRMNYAKFYFLWDGRDEVRLENKDSPLTAQDLGDHYQHGRIQHISLDNQMQMCAEIILQGIREPERGQNTTSLLDAIPKLLTPPGLQKRRFQSGWAFYATQKLCMGKLLAWMSILLTLGVVFMAYWLCQVDNLDVQTAMTPISTLATILALGLGMLALAHN